MIQWVVKLSKLCNLRCKYCYEFPHLGNPERISESDLDRFFRHVEAYAAETDERMDFVWHGGEPLLASPDYFERLFQLQEDRLSGIDGGFRNSIQTNLFRIDDQRLVLLRRFDGVGVSLDLFGDLRVDVGGKPSQLRVLENMDRLREAGVPFGCITVLSRPVAEQIDAVFDFYASAGISFRLLPLYRTAFSGQHDDWALEPEEVEGVMREVFDLMMERGAGITVSPLDDYLANVLRRYVGYGPPRPYPSGERPERLYVVDTDGQIYSSSNAYEPGYSHGNIFESGVRAMRSRGSGFGRTLADRRERLRVCERCEFRDCCPRTYMAEATREQRRRGADGELACPVARRLHEHIDQWLQRSELVHPELGVLDVTRLDPYLKRSGSSLPTSEGAC